MFERTLAFEVYIAPARRYPAVWRLVVGLVTGVAVYFGISFVILQFGIGPAALLFPELEGTSTYALLFGNGTSPGQMFLILATFIGMGLGALAMAAWHRRGMASLLGPRDGFTRLFMIAVAVLICIQALYALVELIVPNDPFLRHLSLPDWAGNLIWSVPLVFIQTTSEELVFRGYVLQQVAARFQHWFWWMVLPSLLFGLGHFDDSIDPNLAYLIVFATTLFGIIASDLTRITGSLAAAMGLHFANNFLALLVVGVPGQLSGLALFHTPFDMSDIETIRTYLMIDIAVLILIWLVLRRVLR